MSLFLPSRKTEATASQLVTTGAAGGFATDPVDGDTGFRPLGSGGREIPRWTLEKARTHSVAGYRMNPMARAIIDTFTSFCVGDSGVSLQCPDPQVREVAEDFWRDPANNLAAMQVPWLQDHLLLGESATEMLVGLRTGVTRFSIIDPSRIEDVRLRGGNPMWPETLVFRSNGEPITKSVVQVDEVSELRTGEVMFWPSFKALLTDRRGWPFLAPILDWLDSYDTVLSNLIDRTALARYLVFDVTLEGADPTAIDEFIRTRGGRHAPPSGTVEVHNEKVKWEPKTAEVGSFEDTNTAKAVLTNIAGGAGLAKTWLADPEDSNRATSLTMAEPVRRRVGGVQNIWIAYQTDLVRYAVDQAVRARRLPSMVDATEDKARDQVRPSDTVTVTGPEIAAADAQLTATVLTNLAQALDTMQSKNLLTPEAAQEAAKKGWEDYMGVPYRPELGTPDADPGDVATAVDDAGGGRPVLQALPV